MPISRSSAAHSETVRPSVRRNDKQAEKLHKNGVHVSQSFTINRPASELYRFWSQFDNLPRFMSHLKSVTILDDRRSHWVVEGPMNRIFEWDAEIINQEPDRLIAWRSAPNADLQNSGSVRFEETPDRGTEVHVTMEYLPPAGTLGKWIAKLTGDDPSQALREDLRHFKQLMETGEIPTNQGPRGSCGHKSEGAPQ